jgi:PhzF family phenazine biosynthesis protein
MTPPDVEIVQVDAFTDQPFAGNPAAVCILPAAADEDWMQAVAAEMNLSETAYLWPVEDGWRLRWFTPTREVELCGHATLASAHVLWQDGHLDEQATARFHTLSGLLTTTRHNGRIEMDFPAQPPVVAEPPPLLLKALGLEPKQVARNRLDYLVEVATEADVRAAAPDFGLLGQVDARGVMVTARSESPDYDFVSRFFGPRYGINEDPVTGSAHCCLAPYWAPRLGRDELIGYQASARGGIVYARLAGERVILGGHAVTVMRGRLV